jgi:hypothetical protein
MHVTNCCPCTEIDALRPIMAGETHVAKAGGIGRRAALVRGLRSRSLSKPRITAARNKLFGRQLAATVLGAQAAPRRG